MLDSSMPPLAFLIAATVLAVTPGPGIAYVVARTVAGGRGEGLASSIGTGVGGLVHVLAGACGLSMLLAQSAVAFSVVKWLGALYLIYLGVRTLMTSRSSNSDPKRGSEFSSAIPPMRKAGTLKAFRDGIMVEALNVKTAMFFLAFIPQFLSPDQSMGVAPQFLLMGCICVLLNTVADVVAVLAAAKFVASGIARAAREKLLSVASGCTMIGLGVYVALTKRQV
jgi:threonine/homoserine/homoserine lactone efflux protein